MSRNISASAKILQDAHKIAYIKKNFPEKKLQEVIKLFHAPSIDINTALWAAQGLGLLSQPDPETDKFEFLEQPRPVVWNFGPEVQELEARLMYGFNILAAKETDLEENKLSSWCFGYPNQDILVAMYHLEEQGKIAEYVLEDKHQDKQTKKETGESSKTEYTFYTLFENRDKEWGRKQFKNDPTTGEPLGKEAKNA